MKGFSLFPSTHLQEAGTLHLSIWGKKNGQGYDVLKLCSSSQLAATRGILPGKLIHALFFPPLAPTVFYNSSEPALSFHVLSSRASSTLRVAATPPLPARLLCLLKAPWHAHWATGAFSPTPLPPMMAFPCWRRMRLMDFCLQWLEIQPRVWGEIKSLRVCLTVTEQKQPFSKC